MIGVIEAKHRRKAARQDTSNEALSINTKHGRIARDLGEF